MSVVDPNDYNPPYSGESWFGTLKGGHNVNDALVNILRTYMDYYVNEVARKNNESFERMVPIKSTRVATEIELMPEDKRTPAIIIVNNGLDDPPIRSASAEGIGYAYTGVFEFDVGIMAIAKGEKQNRSPRAMRLAWLYATAMIGCLIQQRDDDKVISMIDLKDLKPDGVASTADRTAALVIARFNVTVPELVRWGTGPLSPDWLPAEPPPLAESPEWPVLTKPSITIGKVPPNEEV